MGRTKKADRLAAKRLGLGTPPIEIPVHVATLDFDGSVRERATGRVLLDADGFHVSPKGRRRELEDKRARMLGAIARGEIVPVVAPAAAPPLTPRSGVPHGALLWDGAALRLALLETVNTLRALSSMTGTVDDRRRLVEHALYGVAKQLELGDVGWHPGAAIVTALEATMRTRKAARS